MKDIQSVYIDTTFCVPQAVFIPSREDTTIAAVDLIADWLSRSHGDHIVHLQYRADLGYENLFVRFSLEFNMKVNMTACCFIYICCIFEALFNNGLCCPSKSFFLMGVSG